MPAHALHAPVLLPFCRLLPHDQQIAVCAYLAQKEQGESPSTSALPFCAKPRAKQPFEFILERCGHRGGISGNGLVFEGRSSGYCCAIGSKTIRPNSGSYYWEVKVTSCRTGDWQAGVGVAAPNVDLNSQFASGPTGWGFFSGGYRAHRASNSTNRFGNRWSAGDVIGLLFDSDKGTLAIWQNGTSLGVLFPGITAEVAPVLFVNSGNRLTLEVGVRPPLQ